MKQPSNITPLCWTTSMRKNKEKGKEKIENKSKNRKKKRKISKKSIRTKNELSKMKKEQNKQLIWRNKKNKTNTVANGGPLLSNN